MKPTFFIVACMAIAGLCACTKPASVADASKSASTTTGTTGATNPTPSSDNSKTTTGSTDSKSPVTTASTSGDSKSPISVLTPDAKTTPPTTAPASTPSTAGNGEAYTLKVNPKVGQTFTYRMVITQSAAGGKPLVNEVVIVNKCTKAENGKFTLTSALKSIKTAQKIPADVLKKQKEAVTTEVIASNGSVDSISTGAGPMSGGMGVVTYPDHPVKVGETWDTQIGTGSQKMSAKVKFEKVDTINGHKVAVLTLALDVKNPAVKVIGVPTFMVDLKDGMARSVTTSSEVSQPNGPTLTSSMSMTRS